jgi:hypothetical protein
VPVALCLCCCLSAVSARMQGLFARERENPRGPGERACGREAMRQSGSTNPGASAMRHHREAGVGE